MKDYGSGVMGVFPTPTAKRAANEMAAQLATLAGIAALEERLAGG